MMVRNHGLSDFVDEFKRFSRTLSESDERIGKKSTK